MPVTEVDDTSIIGWEQYQSTRLGRIKLPTASSPDALRIEGAGAQSTIRLANLEQAITDRGVSTKGQVDQLTEGLNVKAPCRLAAESHYNVGNLTPGQLVDDVPLSLGDRVLLRFQNSDLENGIYIVTETTGVRSDDFQAYTTVLKGAYTYVLEGGTTVYTDGVWQSTSSISADRGFFCPGVLGSPNARVGEVPVVWEQFSARAGMYAGYGLKVGYNSELDVDPAIVPYLAHPQTWTAASNTFNNGDVVVSGTVHLQGTSTTTNAERKLVLTDTGAISSAAPESVVNWQHLYESVQRMYWKRPVRTVVSDWSWSLIFISPTNLAESTYTVPALTTHNLANEDLFGFPLDLTSKAYDGVRWHHFDSWGMSSWDRVNMPALFDNRSGYTVLAHAGYGGAQPGGDTAAIRRRIKSRVHGGSTAWIQEPLWRRLLTDPTAQPATTTWDYNGTTMEYPYVRINFDMGAKCLLRKFKWSIYESGYYVDPVTFTVWGSNDPNFMADTTARVVKHDYIVNRESGDRSFPFGPYGWSSSYGGGYKCPSVTHEVDHLDPGSYGKIWEVNSFQKVAGYYPYRYQMSQDHPAMNPDHPDHWRRDECSVAFECDRMDPTRWKVYDGITGQKHDGHALHGGFTGDYGQYEWFDGTVLTSAEWYYGHVLPSAWVARGGYANPDEALYFRPFHRLTKGDYSQLDSTNGVINANWAGDWSRNQSMQWYPRAPPGQVGDEDYLGSSYPVTTPVAEAFRYYCVVITTHSGYQYNGSNSSVPYTAHRPIEVYEFAPSVVSSGGKPQAGFLTKDAEVNGLSMQSGDRVLLMAQSDPAENGIYRINGDNDPPTRTDDLGPGTSAHGAVMVATEGQKGRDVPWLCTNDVGADVVASDGLTFTAMAVSAAQLAGEGLSVDSQNQMQIATDNTTTETLNDTLQVRGGLPNCILGDKNNVFVAGTATDGDTGEPIPNLNTIGSWTDGTKYQVDPGTGAVLTETNQESETYGQPLPVLDADSNPVPLNPLSIEDNPDFASVSRVTGAVRIGTSDTAGVLSPSGLGIGGHLHCNALYNHSDQRLKTDLVSLGDDALRVIESLSGYRFNWKKDGRDDVGVSAQEVRLSAPLCVETGGEYLSVDYNKLVPYLIEGVKTLKRGIEQIEQGQPTTKMTRTHHDHDSQPSKPALFAD